MAEVAPEVPDECQICRVHPWRLCLFWLNAAPKTWCASCLFERLEVLPRAVMYVVRVRWDERLYFANFQSLWEWLTEDLRADAEREARRILGTHQGSAGYYPPDDA